MRKIFLLLALAGSAAALRGASVLYTNFGPGESYQPGLSGGASGTVYFAEPFTATGTGLLSQVVLPVVDDGGSVVVGLYANSAGQPGLLLGSARTPGITDQTFYRWLSGTEAVLSGAIGFQQ